jgi:ankyrin repeat protein
MKRSAMKENPVVRLVRLAKESKQNDPRLVELLHACRDGKLAAVRRLLKAGLSPNAIAPGDVAMDTAISAAVYARQSAVLRLLAAAGADFNDGVMFLPLVLAAGWRHLPLVQVLIEGGADVNLPDDSGVTPLRAAILGGPPNAKGNPLPIVVALLDAGADPNLFPRTHSDYADNETPLTWAAYRGNRKMADLLVAAGAKNPNLEALLLCGAAHRGNLDEVRDLVKSGVDVNQRDAFENTPLVQAALTGKQKVVAFLLKSGANPNLHEGARNPQRSALSTAAVYGYLSIVRMLVESGANVSFRTRATKYVPGLTALDWAREESQNKVVGYLKGLAHRT